MQKTTQRPIIFIASCFGGLLLAKVTCDNKHPKTYIAAPTLHLCPADRNLLQALVTCSQAWQAENQPVLDYTVGIIFLGTPFHGTAETHQNATELRLVLESAARNTTAAHLAEYVGKGEDAQATLHEVVADFSHLIRLERANISVICYHETQMTDYSSIASTLPESFRERLDKNNRATVSRSS